MDSSLPCVITNYALTQLLKDHTTARDFLEERRSLEGGSGGAGAAAPAQ